MPNPIERARRDDPVGQAAREAFWPIAEQAVGANPSAQMGTILNRALSAAVAAVRVKVEAGLGAEPYHVMDVREDGWTIKHPLSCRPHLFDCPVNHAAEDLDGPIAQPGRWVVELGASGELRAVREDSHGSA